MTSGTSGWERVGQEFRKVRHEAARTVIEDSYFVPAAVERIILASAPQAIDELFDAADKRVAHAEARAEAAERLMDAANARILEAESRAQVAERLNGELVAALRVMCGDLRARGYVRIENSSPAMDLLARIESAREEG